jgi:hypothetical protein
MDNDWHVWQKDGRAETLDLASSENVLDEVMLMLVDVQQMLDDMSVEFKEADHIRLPYKEYVAIGHVCEAFSFVVNEYTEVLTEHHLLLNGIHSTVQRVHKMRTDWENATKSYSGIQEEEEADDE